MNTNIRKSLLHCRPRCDTAEHLLAGAVEELAAFAMRFFLHSAQNGAASSFFREGELVREMFVESTEKTANGAMLPPQYFARYMARLVSLYGEHVGRPLSVLDFFPTAEDRARPYAQGVLSLVPNEAADAAKEAFEPHAHFKSVIRPRSYATACEDVHDGMSEYCILPLFHAVEGKLYAFYRLMERYELVIDRVADVPMDDGESVSRLALLRTFSPSLFGGKTGEVVLSVSFMPEEHFSLGYLLSVVEALGGAASEVDSVPVGNGADSLEYGISVCHRAQDTPLLLAAIAAMSSVWALKGYYPVPNA